MASTVFEKLVNNRLVDHLEKGSLFSDFHCSFSYSQLTADLVTAISDTIAKTFKRYGSYSTYSWSCVWYIQGFGYYSLVLYYSLYSRCDQTTRRWQQIEESASDLESDLRDTVTEAESSWLISMLEKFNLICWLIELYWCSWCETGLVFSWRKILY